MARPAPRFNDFIGHPQTVSKIRRILAGAQQRKEPFPHSLLTGPSGVGKTMLAQALAREYGAGSEICYGNVSVEKLAEKLVKLTYGDFLVIDEAHNLHRDAQELLYRAIDDHVVPAFQNDGGKKPELSPDKLLEVQPFTVVLATDQPGELQKAMRRRLGGNEFILGYYELKELTEIVTKICQDNNVLITPQAAKTVATISRGIPGVAKNHVHLLRLWYPNAEQHQLGKSEISAYCIEHEIDEQGLVPRDLEYLAFLFEVGQASLESLEHRLGTDSTEVRRNIEPYLLRLGLVEIAKGGRRLTEDGRKKINSRPFAVDKEVFE